ncbi:Translin-1 [Vermiconidia calcicola]|uniref:Translin-1 n=1 Tax=Vermiconidia calcicola TaxID=1690605 RepID=A0ACC3MIS3_9PEZI|nr:Translin-1 [Vermiconidia calcicola]
MAANSDGMMQTSIFENLQRKIDEDTAIKDALRDVVQTLEKQDRNTQSTLSRAHSTSSAELPSVVKAAQASIQNEVEAIQQLSEIASKNPYYKFNYAWTRQMQDACFSILLCGYLGGFGKAEGGQLLTIEEVGQVMNVPVNLKNRDAFHLTIEEYLLALVSLLEELARLARNSVTLGDYRRPLQISQFIKDVHAGFQILSPYTDGQEPSVGSDMANPFTILY